jgi:hypothetical protein
MNEKSMSPEPNAAANSSWSRASLSAQNHKPVWRRLLRILLLICFVGSVKAQEYVGKDLYVLTSPAGYGRVTLPTHGVIALGQCVGSSLTFFGGATAHALVWSPPMGEVVDVHPAGWLSRP